MALDRFIASVRAKVANSFNLKTDAEINAFFIGLEESAKDNQVALEKRDKMLRDTVAELCEAKRLLKSAAKIVNSSLCCDDDLCSECVHSEECQYSVDYDRCFEWKYENTEEYKKLIGGSENE